MTEANQITYGFIVVAEEFEVLADTVVDPVSSLAAADHRVCVAQVFLPARTSPDTRQDFSRPKGRASAP
ncbi:MAG: hypothetical protein KJ052_10490, partial [Candidatus Hydrogenedentes bacterium]|nr:hypothetical protein [Candidatus Hydrogenedentota bacterium]